MDTAFTVLLLGGGEGMGPVAATAHAVARRLAATGKAAQLVVICGRNERLRQSLQQSDWPIPVQVCGFRETTCRNGWPPATASSPRPDRAQSPRRLICGLPILLSGFIPGQEEGNVSFVVQNGVGAYRDSPEDIAVDYQRLGRRPMNWPRCPPAPANWPALAPPMTSSMRLWSFWTGRQRRRVIVDRRL